MGILPVFLRIYGWYIFDLNSMLQNLPLVRVRTNFVKQKFQVSDEETMRFAFLKNRFTVLKGSGSSSMPCTCCPLDCLCCCHFHGPRK